MKSIAFSIVALAAISWCPTEVLGNYYPNLYGDVRYRYSQDPYYSRFWDNKYGSIYRAYQPVYYQAPSREVLSPLHVKYGDSFSPATFPSTISYRNPAVPVVSTYRPIIYTTPKPFVVSTPAPSVYLKSVSDKAANIVREDRTYDANNYRYAYETENGIAAAESGAVDSDANGGGTKVAGFYEYIGDDGRKYRVDYTADENGYRASGAHLPKAS